MDEISSMVVSCIQGLVTASDSMETTYSRVEQIQNKLQLTKEHEIKNMVTSCMSGLVTASEGKDTTISRLERIHERIQLMKQAGN